MKNKIEKEFIWNMIGSGFAAFNSLFFMIIVTRINGIKEAGVFTLCYTTASILYIIAIYSGRTYQVTEINKSITDGEYILNRIVTSLIAFSSCIIFGMINKYVGNKFNILILLSTLRIIEALCDVFHGIFQKNNRLDLVGKSLVIRSAANVIVFFIIDYITNNIVLSCIGMIIVDIIVLILYDIRISNKYRQKTKTIKIKNIRNIFIEGFFTFSFTFLSNYLINIPRYSIDKYLSESFQTVFGIIIMPGTFILLISQFIIQPFIMRLKKYKDSGKKKEYNDLIRKISLYILLIGVVFIVGAAILGIPILETMYGIDLKKYKLSLIIVIIGTILYSLCTIISASLIVLRKTGIQLVIYLVTLIIWIFVSKILVKNWLFNGGIYSYLFIMLELFIFYLIVYIFVLENFDGWKKIEKL